MKQLSKQLFLIGTLVAISGCTSLGGTHYATRATEPLHSIKQWQQQQENGVNATQLTALIDSAELQKLIQKGLDNNPGVLQTALAIEIARQNLSDTEGDRLPQASFKLTHSNGEDSSPAYQGDLQVSWTLDWWRQLQDNADASQANLVKQVAADQAARDLLAATITTTWLQLIQQQRLIAIEQRRLVVLEQNENTIVERYRKGLDELTDLDSARSRSASSRATLSAYQEGYQVLQRSMATLLGETTYQAHPATTFPSSQIPLASIPAQDLGRRPDLQQAYLDIEIADLNSAIAYKSLLPSLSLGLSLSQSSSTLRDSLLTSPAWGLLNQLTAPLFQGGKLRAQAKSAELRAEQAYWRYQEQLLAAVKEVEDAIGQERSLAAQQAHIEDALLNAERSFDSYQSKYRQGLVSFLDLLTIQTQTFDLQIQKTQLIYSRLSNRITLGLALGLGVAA